MPQPLRLLFHEPRIPQNTGSTIRLSAITGCELHVAGPLGFSVDDARLRRAGLDYHDLAQFFVHENLEAALDALLPGRVFAFTAQGEVRYTDIDYRPGDVLLMGPEPTGLAPEVLGDPRVSARVRVPMRPGRRSLNLSTTAGIVVYEAWRQLGFAGGQ